MIGQKKIYFDIHIFIIFEALIPYLEHKGRLLFKNVWILILDLDRGKLYLNYLGTKKALK